MAIADGILGPADLPAAFRAIAAIAREYAADERAAAIWERAAEMAEESLRRFGLERMKLPQAAGRNAWGYTNPILQQTLETRQSPSS